MQLILGR